MKTVKAISITFALVWLASLVVYPDNEDARIQFYMYFCTIYPILVLMYAIDATFKMRQ